MNEEMECMCMECGMSNYLPQGDIVMENPSGSESKILDALLVCSNCGGQLKLIGKAGDEPFYRLE